MLTTQLKSTNPVTKQMYLKECEVALETGMTVKWLQKMRNAGGGIRYHKFGRAVRYSRTDVDAWVATCGRSSTSDPG